jgi:hypothetical protein
MLVALGTLQGVVCVSVSVRRKPEGDGFRAVNSEVVRPNGELQIKGINGAARKGVTLQK